MFKKVSKGAIVAALASALSLSLAGCGTSQSAKSVKAAASKSVRTAFNQYIVVEAAAKLGTDGKKHDAFINGNIQITQNQPVTLHFLNYDDAEHTYVSPKLGLGIKIKGSTKKSQPKETTYTFTPSKSGTFPWNCTDACDDTEEWSMSQQGYMAGKITVLPAGNQIQHVSMVVNPGYKLGSDGKKHDSFAAGDITLKAGQPAEVTVYNLARGEHSITAKDLGLHFTAKASEKDGVPAVSTFTFTPQKEGKFMWMCTIPCDTESKGWAMSNDNYMMGYFHAVN
jgi:plastocyanin